MSTGSLKSNQVKDADVEKSKSTLSDTNSDSKLVMGKKPETETEKSSVCSIIIRLTVASICGIFFGIALEKGRGKLFCIYKFVALRSNCIVAHPFHWNFTFVQAL